MGASSKACFYPHLDGCLHAKALKGLSRLLDVLEMGPLQLGVQHVLTLTKVLLLNLSSVFLCTVSVH